MDGLNQDPFLRTFLSRIRPEVACSFSSEQLDAIRLAYGARTPGAHLLDLRLSVPLGSRSFYVVLLCGRNQRSRERRSLERRLRPIWTFATAVLFAALLIMGAGAAISTLYVTKRALHINVIPGIDVLPDRTIERLLP